MTIETIIESFGFIHASYGDRFPSLSREKMYIKAQAWHQILNQLSDESYSTAVLGHCQNSPHPPSPAEIHAAAALLAADRSERLSEAQRTQEDRYLYGSSRNSWVYCDRCRMAITLDERCDSAVYVTDSGWHHAVCPPRGTRPLKANHPTEEPARKPARQHAWYEDV
ncbi:MAG: hypothetical protein ACLQUT_05365 [Thermoleophilia bacterium]